MTDRERADYDVAILGAGPVGVEAALRSVQDGYRTILVGATGAACREWGHVRMFTPWRMNTSERGRAIVADLPLDDCPTGAELAQRYLDPLVADLDGRLTHVADGFVESVVRVGWPKRAGVGAEARATAAFELRGLPPEPQPLGTISEWPVDGNRLAAECRPRTSVVLDCTGTFNTEDCDGTPNNGFTTPEDARRIDTGLKDWTAWWAELPSPVVRVLVLGGGASAATDAIALSDLGLAVTIATRGPHAAPDVVDDPLPNRARLFDAVRKRVADGRITFVPNVTLAEAVALGRDHERPCLRHLQDGEPIRTRVRFRTASGQLVSCGEDFDAAFDLVIDDTGFVPDVSLFRELQVHLCYATEGPMALAAHLMSEDAAAGDGPVDCLSQSGGDASLLATTEPGFFILGAKSYGRRSNFLLRAGLEQVDAAFDELVPAHLDRVRQAVAANKT